MTTIKNPQTATPVEIDIALANLHAQGQRLAQTVGWNEDRILDMAGMRNYVRPTRWGQKGYYEKTGTFAEARALVERWTAAYNAERGVRYEDLSADALKGISTHDYGTRYLADHDKALVELQAVTDEMVVLNTEFVRRGGWTRKFLVTSSAGHLHQDECCSTCRRTTTYGWWPQLSGLTEAEAIAALGKHADALCSVCFPSAPVARQRTNITKAQANKIAEQALTA